MSTYKNYNQIPLANERRSVDEAEAGSDQKEEQRKGQEERLLSADDGELEDDLQLTKEELFNLGDVENVGVPRHHIVWASRIAWVLAGTLFTVLLFVAGSLIFTRHLVIGGGTNVEDYSIGDFRRPASDYILDPSWNFDAAPTVRAYNWKIIDIVGYPDGVYREMITINGLFPGPLIECNEGDTIIIDVDNQSVNATAIHFHGLFQNGTNYHDGVPGITQCPIPPKRNFRYEFTVSGQSGTYYYHGHQAVQTSDGLYGPMVIHARNEKTLQQIPYASDRVIMLQDHYHDLSSGLLESFLKPTAEGAPSPNGALINGMNKRDCSLVRHHVCDNSTASIPSFILASNSNHRLRFINVAAFAWFQVSIDEHAFAVTEVDGTDIYPVTEDRMMIAPAQRYSIILTTNNTSSNAFWLRARMVTSCWMHPNILYPGDEEARAMLYYTSSSTSSEERPTSSPSSRAPETECVDMNTTSYTPVTYDPPPEKADHRYHLTTSSLTHPQTLLTREYINTSTFHPNLQSPTLHRTILGLQSQNASFTTTDGLNDVCYDKERELTIQHAGIKVVDLVLQNKHNGNHPMHLHGHKFWVLGSGPGYTPSSSSSPSSSATDSIPPQHATVIRRDVATLPALGWLWIRFTADNPGIWAFHCHMAWHAEAGLGMQFISRVDDLAFWKIPEGNLALCDVSAPG